MANAFEIRLELLKMAKELLVEQYYSERDPIMQEWERKSGIAIDNNQALPNLPKYPDYPNSDKIITKAKELNRFISNE